MKGLHLHARTYRPREGTDSDWQQAGPRREFREERQKDQHSGQAQEPLEGEFISRDDSR